ncbi:aspartyl-phosphate phosphatase Spo0E family protein [Bacillus pinisoli]|uniref:aspartyl-phosphate phosphatase Spo0E family protein n=1 Tax=Bacillus pinisoli TaxID=2901866 RepID=UPI001FF2F95F|nr:aspartyl-phosphate phosphatase Spo0E family protein [Bacillus pinisoli]
MNKEKLIQEIEKKRAEMTQLGVEKGLTNDETIQSSQQLDQLLNLLQLIKVTQR